jgi:hypothetical protein
MPYNIHRLPKVLGQHEFADFCRYYRQKRKEDTGVEDRDLDDKHLRGETPSDRATSLIDREQRGGHLPDLIFHFSNYWFESGWAGESFVHTGCHQELCVAALELWTKEHGRSRAATMLDRLATVDGPFGEEWSDARTRIAGVRGWEPSGSTACDPSTAGSFEPLAGLTRHLAACRRLHKEAIGATEKHQWQRARTLFQELAQLQRGYADVAQWLQSLADEDAVSGLQRVADAVVRGFAYDDRLPWEGSDYPYVLFGRLGTGIDPRSSMEQLRTALQGVADREQRSRLEAMLQVEQRLLADSFLYPSVPSVDALRFLEESFRPGGSGGLPTSEAIRGRFPELAGLIFAILDRDDEATRTWEAEQRRRPRDGRLAHYQGLAYLVRAQRAHPADLKMQRSCWEQAIAHWSVAVADTSYWMDWGRERYASYGEEFLVTPITRLGTRIHGAFGQRILEQRRLAEENRQSERVAMLETLYLEAIVELAATHLLRELGGIPVGDGRIAWFGPIWMGLFGLRDALEAYIARVAPDEGLAQRLAGSPSPDDVVRLLRWYFSYLSIPLAMLSQAEARPAGDTRAPRALELGADRALVVLTTPASASTEPRCDDPDCPLHGEVKYPVVVRCPYSPSFARENPPYARAREMDEGDPGRAATDRMIHDALYLAIAAHLELAQVEIDRGRDRDREKLLKHWAEALDLASRARSDAKQALLAGVRTKIQNVVLSRTTPERHLDRSQLDERISLLELVREPTQALKVRLAELLVQRVRKVQPTAALAEEDLKRALALVPHLGTARHTLATIWVTQANETARSDRFRSLDFLRRAEALLTTKEAQSDFDHGEILQKIRRARDELGWGAEVPARGSNNPAWEKVITGVLHERELPKLTKLYAQAAREGREQKPDRALETLSEALQIEPLSQTDRELLEKAAAAAVVDAAVAYLDNGEHDKGLDVMRQWMPRLQRQPQLKRQFEFLRRWPRLRSLLNDGHLVYQVPNYEAAILAFEASNVDSLLVRLELAEGDRLTFTAPLPHFPPSQLETVLGTLLQASADMISLKIVTLGNNDFGSFDSDFGLCTVLPFRLLVNRAVIVQAAFWLKRCADVPQGKLSTLRDLRAWFQEMRAGFIEELSRPNVGPFVEASCKERQWDFTARTEHDYTVVPRRPSPLGPVHIEAHAEGVRVAARLGHGADPTNSPREFYHDLIKRNTSLVPLKLALKDDGLVTLSVELTYLDEDAVNEAFDLLASSATVLRKELDLR